MRTLISFAALFLSVLLVQLGSGTLGPLDALAGSVRGFTTEQIGLLGSAHFLGFFAGCYLAPRYIGSVGHSRAFAAAAAVGAIGALLHPVFEGPYEWAMLRLLTGLAVASAYTVIESWLQAKIESSNRGRVFGVFRVVDMSGSILAQGLIAVLDPASYASYNIVAVFCCLCLLPLSLTRRDPPPTPQAPRLRPIKAALLSPSACFGIIVAGVTGASFRMVGPVFGIANDLSQSQVALFLTAGVVGGAAAQFPVGWIADQTDRRNVLVGLSAAAIVSCLTVAYLTGPGNTAVIFIGAFLFGMTSYPIYSVSAAYANDFAPKDFVVELNAALIFFYSIGAIVSPFVSARLISAYGPAALFLFIATAHGALILFTLYRMTRRKAPARTTPYTMVPRTSMIIGRLLRRKRNGAPAESAPEPVSEEAARREP
ncbi:MAG TPA: MFS transporter [Thermohalobaculum sp.]|nr:MFS transporter [Thermohalobaculum sp.]